MKQPHAVGIWIVAMLTLVATTLARWRRPEVSPVDTLMIPVVRVGQERFNATTLDSLGSEIVADDPFRLVNTPSRARYAVTAQSTVPVVTVVRDPRPTMTLKAIAGGPPWRALIDGVPGQAHAVLVQSGTVFDRLSIGAITLGGVVVRGPDTTWVLSFASRP